MTNASLANDSATDAARVPYVTPAEAEKLIEVEWRRMLALLESLDEGDWAKPTACTEWDVRAMTAHQAGAYTSGVGHRELLHQYTAALNLRRLPEDAINARQLAERAGRSPAELLGEIRAAGQKAAHNWAHGFGALKLAGIPHPTPGWLSVRHLMLVVHSRDAWMHRLDICRATARPFEQTPEHDGRINALVVRDLARSLVRKLGQQTIGLELAGIAGGRWRIGQGRPTATIQMDAIDFNIYASGRMTNQEATQRAVLGGNNELAERALRSFAVLY